MVDRLKDFSPSLLFNENYGIIFLKYQPCPAEIYCGDSSWSFLMGWLALFEGPSAIASMFFTSCWYGGGTLRLLLDNKYCAKLPASVFRPYRLLHFGYRWRYFWTMRTDQLTPTISSGTTQILNSQQFWGNRDHLWLLTIFLPGIKKALLTATPQWYSGIVSLTLDTLFTTNLVGDYSKIPGRCCVE